jgi:undecaprenyl-diphosphatase
MLKNRQFLIILILLLASIITVSVFAYYNDRFPGDLWLARNIQSMSSDFLTSIMQGISFIFDSWFSYIMVVIISLLVWWRTGWKEAVLVVVGGILSATGALFKAIIDRPRPSPDLVMIFSESDRSSFPSGHSFFAMMVFGLVAYFAVTRLRNGILRTSILLAVAVLILLLGISRIYLGAHWPSDVVGGYLYGGIFLTMLIWIDKVWFKNHLKETTKSE